MMTKRKMLARLTIARATPARLMGLRSSMRERCQGSCGSGGVFGVFSVSMVSLCDFGCIFWLDRDVHPAGPAGRHHRRFPGLALNQNGVESMLIAVMVQGHFSVPPGPVHWVHIRVEEHLVEVPH